MVYDITGYRTAGRMPLNHALRAGQFRTGTVNLFPFAGNYTTINNYCDGYYGYDNYYGYEEPGMSSMMKWALGLSIGGGFLGMIGNIILALGGGGGSEKSEGKGSTTTTEEQTKTKELAAYKEAYKDKCKISDTGSGYLITPKGGNPIAVPYEDLKTKLEELYPPDGSEPAQKAVTSTATAPKPARAAEESVTVTPKTKQEVDNEIKAMLPEWGLYKLPDGITFDNNKGCYVDGSGKELRTMDDLINAVEYSDDPDGKRTFFKLVNGSFDFNSIKDNFRGVYDWGLGNHFGQAKIESVDGDIVTMDNGRKYQLYKQNNDGYVYLKDITEGADYNGNQVYILAKDQSGNYSLEQLGILGDKTSGYGKAAKTRFAK